MPRDGPRDDGSFGGTSPTGSQSRFRAVAMEDFLALSLEEHILPWKVEGAMKIAQQNPGSDVGVIFSECAQFADQISRYISFIGRK